MYTGGTQAFYLPSLPVKNITEVLLYVKLFTGETMTSVDDIRIFTEIQGVQYSKYIYLYVSTVNSDNIWLPMGKDKRVFVELEATHKDSAAMYMYLIGYR